MNISIEPRHRPKHIQLVPEFDQDAERVTEIIVDNAHNTVKPILKKNRPHTTTIPQSPLRNLTVNPIRAGTLRSPSMDIAPDFHLIEKPTDRPTTEAVDPPNTTITTETIASKPNTMRIKRSLLLEPLSCDETLISPSSLNSQSEDEVEDTQPIMADETIIQPESQPGVANGTPQQDKSRSYPSEQTAEYPRKNHTARETLIPLSRNDRQPENEVEDPRPTETATTDTQSGSPTGAVNDTPPQNESQSYPTAQIAEYLTRDPVTNEKCIPIFSAVTIKKKKKMLFAPMDFQDLTLDALIDSGALVNCISETDYNKIFQMSPKDIVENWNHPLQTPSRERRYRNPHKDDHPPIRDRGQELQGNIYQCKTTLRTNTRPHFSQE